MPPKSGENLQNGNTGTEQDLFNIKVFLIAAGILGAAFLGLTWLSRGELGLGDGSNLQQPEVPAEATQVDEPEEPPSQLSQGEKVLLVTSTLPLKEDGAEALASGDYDAAVTAFENARNVDISDPETLIYLNNARIGENEAHGLAVIVPLEKDSVAASNLLRGVAQAQTEVNQAGGIQGKPLRLFLADDQGDVAIAQEIATELSQSPDILGVIGHSGSATTEAAAEIYTGEFLPFVSTSPVSAASQPILPANTPVAEALAFYMVKLNHRTAILFYDGNSDYSLSFKKSFEEVIKANESTLTAQINLTDLPNSAPTETPEAEIFVLSPGDSPLKTATESIEIIPNDKVDHFYRHVFGGYELFNPEVLELFGSMATGTILAVPDTIYRSAASPFSDSPRTLWQTTVDWTTSASYETVQAIISGIQQAPTREGVQSALDARAKDSAVRLLRIRINADAASGYELLPIGTMTSEGFKAE
ncbi:MAG: ABC transporter substrate-binding protein [Cyanobacteria bacterium P01_F01_bin.13]